MEETCKNANSGVCCDVTECVHNVDGCNCEMDTIKVTGNKQVSSHFCKTFECANNEKSDN